MTPSPTSLELIHRLVGFDTVSARSNMALIDYVRDYLARHGIASRIVPNADGTKANLFATIGPEVPGGIALAGHTDVVPVEDQTWSSDPFRVTERDGRLYGRGTADMKSFIAVALALVPAFKARNLKRPIHLCLSYDEEVGCFGMPALLRLLGTELPKPSIAIIGEPTSMRVANAHKGIVVQRVTITGREWHSSAPQYGANAITLMARFVTFLDELQAELETAGDTGAVPGLEFDPPWTTINVGTIAGGTALNIVAGRCELLWEFRALPGVDPGLILARVESFLSGELLSRLRARAPEGTIEMTQLCAVPALRPEPDGAAETLARRLTGQNATVTVAFASEAGQFQEAGISAVLCGPGDIAQAHKPDEFITRDQVAQCEAFLLRIADWASQ